MSHSRHFFSVSHYKQSSAFIDGSPDLWSRPKALNSCAATEKPNADGNVARLQRVAADTSDSNTHMGVMQKAIRGVGTLMNHQERAITGIHAAVGHLLALSADTNQQTDTLHALATELNDTASGLNRVVGKFKLRAG